MRQHPRSLTTILLMICSMAFPTGTATGQAKEWTIIPTSADSLVDCALDSLVDSRLWFHRDGGPESMTLDSLLVLFSPGRSHGIEGMLIGAVAGGTIGYLTAGDPYGEQHSTQFIFTWTWQETRDPQPGATVFGTTIGGVLGYFVGANIGGEKCYEFFADSPQKKAWTVRAIILGSR